MKNNVRSAGVVECEGSGRQQMDFDGITHRVVQWLRSGKYKDDDAECVEAERLICVGRKAPNLAAVGRTIAGG